MLQVFIDESGDLGCNEGYFIIALLVARDPRRIKNLITSFCKYHKLSEAHAAHLNFPQKQFLVNGLIKQGDHDISYIVADKMMIKNKKLFHSNNLLFNYLFSFLVEDIIRSNSDDLSIYLDNRNQKVASINSLKEYIQIKAYAEWGYTKNLWIGYMDSKNCKSLQMVDLIASCIRRKYHHKNSDFYDKLEIMKSIKFPIDSFRG